MMSGDFCLSFRSVALFYFIRFWFISCLLPLESFVFFFVFVLLIGLALPGKGAYPAWMHDSWIDGIP